MESVDSSCPYNPAIDNIDTAPSILNINGAGKEKAQPVALRKSSRVVNPPDILTYQREPDKKKSVTSKNKSQKKADALKKSIDIES